MVEKSQESTVIDASAIDASAIDPGAVDASQTAQSPINLSLFVAIAAFIVSAVALFFVIRGDDTADLNARDVTFESIEARLKAIEAAPVDSSADLAALRAELDFVKATIDGFEDEFDDKVAALNDEMDGVLENLSARSLAPTAAMAAAALESSDSDALDLVSEELAALTARVEGSEVILNTMTERVFEAFSEIQASSEAEIDDIKSAVATTVMALKEQSITAEMDLRETEESLKTQLAETREEIADELISVRAAMDQNKIETADQFVSVNETITGLGDEFVAMKEVSVETSTKVLAVNQLRDALASSAPVRPHMSSLEALNPTEAVLLEVLETVDSIADQRVPTQQILAETIAALSPRLVNETRINSAEGTGGKALARLGSVVTIERVDDIAVIPGIEGNMARAVARVREGDFEAALTELQDDTVEMNLNPETKARFDALVSDLGHRATYEEQRRKLGDWVTTTLNAARASVAN